jgi:hypothetical protein
MEDHAWYLDHVRPTCVLGGPDPWRALAAQRSVLGDLAMSKRGVATQPACRRSCSRARDSGTRSVAP